MNECTEMQNPRRSVCGIFAKFFSLVSLALVHALRFLSCPCLCKVCSLVSDALLVSFATSTLAWHGQESSILCFSPSSKHMFTLSGTDPTALHCEANLARRHDCRYKQLLTYKRGLPTKGRFSRGGACSFFCRVKMVTPYDSCTMQEAL